jgi:hypothetical protein
MSRTRASASSPLPSTLTEKHFHATLLHLLGLDHECLTFRHAVRDFLLTDTKGNVVTGLLA